eukprot:811320_1
MRQNLMSHPETTLPVYQLQDGRFSAEPVAFVGKATTIFVPYSDYPCGKPSAGPFIPPIPTLLYKVDGVVYLRVWLMHTFVKVGRLAKSVQYLMELETLATKTSRIEKLNILHDIQIYVGARTAGTMNRIAGDGVTDIRLHPGTTIEPKYRETFGFHLVNWNDPSQGEIPNPIAAKIVSTSEPSGRQH